MSGLKGEGCEGCWGVEWDLFGADLMGLMPGEIREGYRGKLAKGGTL